MRSVSSGDFLDPASDPASDRVLKGLLTGLAVAWCAWLAVSGNSRYFLPMACVAGAILALVLQRTYARWPDATRVGIALVLLVQIVQIVLGTDWRRESRAWGGPWLSVQVPQRLRDEPFLYLSLGFQSGSALARYLHPDSGMMNVSGFQVIAPGHPGGDRAQRLIDRYRDRVRMLLPLSSRDLDERNAVARVGSLSGMVGRFGFRVAPTDCEIIRINGTLRGVIEAPEKKDDAEKARPEIRFLTCRLVFRAGGGVELRDARQGGRHSVRPCRGCLSQTVSSAAACDGVPRALGSHVQHGLGGPALDRRRTVEVFQAGSRRRSDRHRFSRRLEERAAAIRLFAQGGTRVRRCA